MPSHYSPDLRIELIQNGEQSGTWGDTTNNNLGSLLEQAIAGYPTVSITSTNQALTALNGAVDQSRNAGIRLTTTLTAPFNVYIPPVTKQYVITNNSAYAASIYASTVLGNTTPAGSGISVPAGASTLIVCDGVNVLSQMNYTADGFTVGGDLSVNGDTSFTGTTTLSGNPTLALQAATKQYVDSSVASGVPSGVMTMWPTGSPPSGWLLCDGSAVSRTTYAALFGVLGTVFGAGDGSSTFNLPDYRDRMPIGANTIAASVGATGGSKDAIVVSHSHSASVYDPGHTHTTTYLYERWNTDGPNNRTGGDGLSLGSDLINGAYTGIGVSIGSTGSSGTDANMPPYLGINFIIKT